MTISHEKLTVSDTAVILTIPASEEIAYSKYLAISIQNLDEANAVLLGDSSVTTSSYGHYLFAGDSITLELTADEEFYAIAETDSVELAVIRIAR